MNISASPLRSSLGTLAIAAIVLQVAPMTAQAEPAALDNSLRVAPSVLYGDTSTLVSYDDLDMSSAEDVKVLAGRLKIAAGSVCGREDLKELKRVLDGRECRDAAFASAMAQLQALTRENRLAVAEAELAP